MSAGEKRQRFIEEYPIDLNAAQAAIRAGYSPATARQAGYRLLTNVDVKKAIQEKMDNRSSVVGVDSVYVLSELLEMAEMDVADILRDDGTIKPVSEWPDVWRLNVSAFDVQETLVGSGEDAELAVLKKIKRPDRKAILELMGKHLDINAWTERKVVEFGEGGLVINRPGDA